MAAMRNASASALSPSGLGSLADDRAVIGFLHPASRKHQGTTCEVDGVVAHDHEYLHAGGSVAQQQDGGGRPGGQRVP